MASSSEKPTWEPPDDPDLKALAAEGWERWIMEKPTVLAFDSETTGLTYYDTPFCFTVAWPDIYGAVEGHYFEVDRFDSRQMLQEMFAHAKVLVGHNLKFDMIRAQQAGIVTDWSQYDLHDTEGMSHLDDEHRPKGLKDLAVELLGFEDTMLVPATRKCKPCDGVKGYDPDCRVCTGTGREHYDKPVPRSKWEIDQAREWAKKQHGLASVKDVGYHLLPRGTVVPYAILDAEWTYSLARLLQPRIAAYPETLGELYAREMRVVTEVLLPAEDAGMATRVDYVRDQVLAYRKVCIKHEQAIQQLVGKVVRRGKIPKKERAEFFNPSSSAPDVGEFLTAHGFARASYDAENLKGIEHPLAKVILEYRRDSKILESYFIALQNECGDDGIFHPSIRSFGTVTGRTSAGKERGDSW